jgi:hypothetical protein
MTAIHLKTTSPPQALSSRKMAQINQKDLLYKLTREIVLKRKGKFLRGTERVIPFLSSVLSAILHRVPSGLQK